MKITFPSENNIPDIYSLWHTCFGDSVSDISLFFSHSYSPENTLICTDNGSLSAMLFMIPEKISSGNKIFSALYLYALGTDPSYRKQGIMSRMISRAEDLALSRDCDCLFLVPASPSLFSYYGKQGFINAFTQKKITLPELLDSFPEDDNINNSRVIWNASEISLNSAFFSSGSGETVKKDNSYYFISHSASCDTVYALNPEKPSLIYSSVKNHLINKNVIFHLSSSCPTPGGELYSAGMIKPLKPGLPDFHDTFLGITLG